MLPSASEKKKISTSFGNPLPIPLEGFDNIPAGRWPVYKAVFDNGDIFVPDQAHMKALYNNGFFGQGTLSEKGLDYELFSKKITVAQYKNKEEWRAGASEDGLKYCNGSSASCSTSQRFVYVYEGTGDEEDRPQLLRDPYPIEESLHLMPEEAMFLSFGLGCLVVFDEENQPLNIEKLWSRLLSEDPELPYRYAAYHHLRCEKWVVRSGVQYGSDYMMYPVGPPFYHAQYLLKVQAFKADTREPLLADTITKSTDLNCYDRVACNVKKMYMLCVVLRPPSLVSLDNVKQCVDKMRVEMLPYTRMIPGRVGREDEVDIDDDHL